MKLYVILLNWNGWKDTVACLQSLLSSAANGFRIVVCDNGSSDGSIEKISEWAERTVPGQWQAVARGVRYTADEVSSLAKILIVDNAANLGFAAGCNAGIAVAVQDGQCEYVWLLNNDTEVEPRAIDAVVEYMDENSDINICGSTLIYHHDRAMIQAYGGSKYSRWLGRSRHLGAFGSAGCLPSAQDVREIESQTSYVVGAAMMIRRELIDRIGGLYEGYFLYYEELDFACRAAAHGRLGYCRDSIVYHKEGASIGTSASGGSPISMYFLSRSKIYFTWRFYPFCLPTVYVCCLWEFAKMLVKRRLPQAFAMLRGFLFLPAPVRMR